MEPIREVLEDPLAFPEGASSVHPLDGGEDQAQGRLGHLIRTGAMSSYKETRNGLLGVDFSTKLSAYLALGCLTARQIHEEMAGYEDGKMDKFKDVTGYGEGENDGTRAVRFELLWRDYMRLCTRKFGPRLFRDSGFREEYKGKWKTANPGVQDEVAVTLQRFMAGTTGMGLIDASQRELYHTGYTSNRARQNVASFLTKHLGIDWRYGAEWYECLLVDYDVSSNWSNWQYVAGVGNDPRGEARIFNPVKQAFDYDKDGEYVRAWVPEVQPLEKLENVFQAWTASKADLDRHHLSDNVMVTHPIKKIEFSVEGKPKASRRPYMRRRGRGGNGNGGNGHGNGNGNGHGNGPGSSNGNSNSNGSTGHGGGGGSPPHDMGNGHAYEAEYYPAPGQQYQQRPYDAYGPGQYGNGNGYRGGPGGSRGQYRGYRGRGGGGPPRGGRGGGAYMTGRWTNGYTPQPPPYDGGAYYGAPMNRPHWATTNPGV
jgi:cryptochrome